MTSLLQKGLMLGIFYFISLSYSAEVCDFSFSACPEGFNGETIVVPEQIVALSSSIKACSTSISSSSTGSSLPPSIMFVIDHSGSMTGTGGGGSGSNDPTGSRFTVTTAFLDSIYKKQPNAEVGIAVFNEHLFFDKTTSAYFSTYLNTPLDANGNPYDGEPKQAYLKMLKLNQTYGTKKGIDIIKDALATKDSTYGRSHYVDLVNQPSFTHALSTNINMGFIAAKDAMKTAANPKERQFVIFFSDGEPQGETQAGLNINDFQKGTNMPTTFTVFFTPNNTAPASITTMTNNIKANGYSSTNSESDLWAIQTNHDALLSLLMSNVINNILVPGDPNRMIINGITSIAATDTSFIFSDRFPLNATNTPFNTVIHYNFKDPLTSISRDSALSLNFVVKRSKNVSLPTYLEKKCWTQPVMNFYYNGTKISEATEDMKQLQIQLSSSDNLSSVSVGLKTGLESMPINLTKQSNGTDWQGTFTRETKTSAVANDNILQHISGDSIIAIYRNPKIPLDTVRVAIAVRAHPGAIPVTATLRDTSGNGKIDRIDLSWAIDTVTLIPNLPAVADFLKSAVITTPNGSRITLNSVSLIKTGERSLAIILNENNGTTLETGWASADVILNEIAMTLQGNSFYVSNVVDGSGPIISRVIYNPGAGSRDTLKVIFSEPVNCASLTPSDPAQSFKYIGKNLSILAGSNIIAPDCSQGYVSEVKIILDPQFSGKVQPIEDSLGINSLTINNGTNKIKDSKGNLPPANSKNVVIEWGTKSKVTSGALSNPFTPGTPLSNLSSEEKSIYGNLLNGKSGTIIAIYSKIPLEPQKGGSFGSARIYDAVGNLVKHDLPIKKAATAFTYGVVWDGTNQNNRIVGSGTYLMLSTVKTDGDTQELKVKIGIKR